jgi:hypothetical protein
VWVLNRTAHRILGLGSINELRARRDYFGYYSVGPISASAISESEGASAGPIDSLQPHHQAAVILRSSIGTISGWEVPGMHSGLSTRRSADVWLKILERRGVLYF